MTPITDGELDHLCNFIGYGSIHADVWFLGMEEAGGGEQNIRTRLSFDSVMDNAEAHKRLGVLDLHFGKRKIQSTWRGMCATMLRVEGHEPTREAIRTYQAEQLGRSRGRTLLAELMPIPKPNIGAWGYEDLIPQFQTRDDYYKETLPKRIKLLSEKLTACTPRAVICYGKSYWDEYARLFPQHNFQMLDDWKVSKHDSQVVVLTSHFTAREMNGKFDALAELIRQTPNVKAYHA